jgi:hypothetical protein
MSSCHAWEIIRTIEPWAIKKEFLSIFLEISNGGYMT